MIHKPKRIVSRKIRKSAQGRHCTLRIPGVCNHDPNTTVLAHINSAHKGISNKSPDIFACYACSDCHSALDSGNVDHADQLRAMMETQMILVRDGIIKVY